MGRRIKHDIEVRADVAARLAAGQTHQHIADETGVPRGSVALLAPSAPIASREYTQIVLASAQRYAAQAWETLDTMARLLGDEDYLRTHGEHVFSLASAHRVVAETLGRILAATNRGDE